MLLDTIMIFMINPDQDLNLTFSLCSLEQELIVSASGPCQHEFRQHLVQVISSLFQTIN